MRFPPREPPAGKNMRINDNTSSSIGASELGRTQAAEQSSQPQKQSSVNRAGSSDDVQLSSLASSVQALEADSPQSLAKIERLRELVASKKYEPDFGAIADRMIDDALDSKTSGPFD